MDLHQFLQQLWILFVFVWLLSGGGCERANGLKGQSNLTLRFYGKAVDQDGKPLPGVRFEYQLEAYPKNWSFGSRDKPNDVSFVSASSSGDGSFAMTVTGCELFLLKAEYAGYRHLTDTEGYTRSIDNRFYRLIAWSDPWYKSDPKNPAVYVFVKDGIHVASALPARGGANSSNGKDWTVNKPAWPHIRSLEDVVPKVSTTDAY